MMNQMPQTDSYFGAEFFLRETEDEDEEKLRMDSESFEAISESSSSPPLDHQPLLLTYGRTPLPIYEEKGESLPYRTIEVTTEIAEKLGIELPQVKQLAVPVQQEKARDNFTR